MDLDGDYEYEHLSPIGRNQSTKTLICDIWCPAWSCSIDTEWDSNFVYSVSLTFLHTGTNTFYIKVGLSVFYIYI